MSLLNRPQIVVEVAFTTNPNDAAAVAAMTAADWTAITQWVRGIPSLDRSKRSTELDRFEAGTAKLTLDNSDGRFSPTNVSSPYAPNVTIYRMIRIRAVWGPTPQYQAAAWAFETDTGGWAVNAPDSGTGAVVFIAAGPHTGAGSMQWTAGSGSFGVSPGVVLAVPTIPGVAYALSGYVYQTSLVGTGLRAAAFSTGLGSVFGGATTTTGAWTLVSTPTFTAVNTTTFLFFLASGTPSAGQSFFVDDAQLLSTSYPRWQGYVERWPTRWVDPAQGLAEIECVDAMAIAAQIGMDGVLENEVLADAPLAYYPCDEGSSATQAANSSTTSQEAATFVATKIAPTADATFGFGGTLAIKGADAQTGADFKAALASTFLVGYGLSLPALSLPWDHFTVECWYQGDASATGISDEGDVLYIANANWGYAGRIIVTSVWISSGTPDVSNFGHLIVTTPDGYDMITTLTAWIRDGLPHHILVTYDGSGSGATVQLYVDHILVNTVSTVSSTFTSSLPTVVQAGIAATWPFGGSVSNSPITGTIGHIAVYNRLLPSARITAHYNAGLIDFPQDLTGTRVTRLLDYVFWPSALRDVQPGLTSMQQMITIANRSLLENLQDVADTENGTLSTTADGKLQFADRTDRMSRTIPVATFGANVAAGEIPIQLDSLQLDYDPTLVFDVVKVERDNAGTATAYNSDAILAYYNRTLSVSTQAFNDDEVQAEADWLLDRYTQPSLRVEQITILPSNFGADVNAWPTLLALDLNDRVRLNHPPMGAPAISMNGHVDQITDDIDPDTGIWKMTIQISPARDYWVLGDAAGSLLGVTTRLAY